jgi:hypothetical protein
VAHKIVISKDDEKVTASVFSLVPNVDFEFYQILSQTIEEKVIPIGFDKSLNSDHGYLAFKGGKISA